MADLRLRVSTITATAAASDANATRILQAMLRQRGYDPEAMTGQQQANAVLEILRQFIVESATSYEANEAAEIARQAVLDAPPTFD
jgi:hypothetical protein